MNRSALRQVISFKEHSTTSKAIKSQWQDLKRFCNSRRLLLSVAQNAYEACAPTSETCDNLHESEEPPLLQDPDRARIVCISDSHSRHACLPPLPLGDVLIHAGDLTDSGTESELYSALAWLNAAPHPHKIFIAGNHDVGLANPSICAALLARFPALTYLQDSSTTIAVRDRLLSIYGSPRTPSRGPHGVFHYGPWEDPRWDASIPPYTDVLVTHGPPAFHLTTYPGGSGEGAGCPALLRALWDARPRPRLHLFGHVHRGRGVRAVRWCAAQAVYEAVCADERGWAAALWLVGVAVRAAMRARPHGDAAGDAASTTMLVNAACKWRDRPRGAIVVDVPLPERP